MSIKTNHSQESLTPDSGVLKVDGSGAVALPVGPSASRPIVSAAGYIRFADDIVKPEYYDGNNWQTITNKEYVDSRITNLTTSIGGSISQLSLNDLTDVNVLNPTDGQVISYDATLGYFRSQTQALTLANKAFTGDGFTLTFDIVTIVPSIQNLVVTINGIQQEPYYSYTLIDGHIMAFDEAPEPGDRLQVKILKSTASSDRPRPRIVDVSYGIISNYSTITVVATDITYGTGAKIGGRPITRIDYPANDRMQLMIESSKMSDSFWNQSQDLTLVDSSGNEFIFPNAINVGLSKPYWVDSNSYIGSFSSGDSIIFELNVNNAVSLTIDPAYAGESEVTWLSISGNKIVGIAPQNSNVTRYEVQITASNGSVNITKNYWLLVL